MLHVCVFACACVYMYQLTQYPLETCQNHIAVAFKSAKFLIFSLYTHFTIYCVA